MKSPICRQDGDFGTPHGQPQIPIHVIGGLASAASTAAIAAFARAASDCSVVGASLYAYPQTTPPQWQQLAKATLENGTIAPTCTS